MLQVFPIYFLAFLFCIASFFRFVSFVSAEGEVFRVTEYSVSGSDFSGSEYDLTLDQPLSEDHFLLIRGAADGNRTRGVGRSYARVTALPSGTNGQLDTSSGSNILTLSRYINNQNWVGVVTVVECLQECDTKGFRLRNVIDISSSGTDTTGTENVPGGWSDISQVVPFGGPFGSGSVVEYSGSKPQDRYASGWIYLVPSGSNKIEWRRFDSASKGLVSARHTVHVVEWGSEWTVQREVIYDSAGGNGADSSDEYSSKNITPVQRENTWVWGTGLTENAGLGDGAEGTLVTLGNGVGVNPTESVVSVGGEYNVLHYFAVYIMTHPQLLVEHLFKPDGDSGLLQLDVPLSSASQEGQRFAWSTNTSNGTGTAYPRPIFSSRYLDDSTVRLERQYKGQNFVAWIQAIDFTRFFPPPEETLEVWFVDEVGSPVLAPSLQMTPLSASLRSQVTSGILGTDAERIRVFVSKRNLEWSLSLAPADGAAALWQDRDLQYDINDPLDTGLDGADPDSVGGQLSVDFSGTTIDTNPECASAITSMGTKSAFLEGVTDSVFLASSKVPPGEPECHWDISGIQLEQIIPPAQSIGAYSLDMVLTVTAI
jgi:hypothetical protein